MHVHASHLSVTLPVETSAATVKTDLAKQAAARRRKLSMGVEEGSEWFSLEQQAGGGPQRERRPQEQVKADSIDDGDDAENDGEDAGEDDGAVHMSTWA